MCIFFQQFLNLSFLFFGKQSNIFFCLKEANFLVLLENVVCYLFSFTLMIALALEVLVDLGCKRIISLVFHFVILHELLSQNANEMFLRFHLIIISIKYLFN